MRARCALLILTLLLCVGCRVDPVNSLGASTPTAESSGIWTATPEPTGTPASTPSPLQTDAGTRTPVPTDTWTPMPLPTDEGTQTPTPTATPGPQASYPRLILIDQDRQTMYVYENGVEIRRIPVSTGKPDEESTITPAWEGEVGKFVGTFFAFGTWADEAWYLFEHYGSILIHGAPYLEENGTKVYQELDALGVRPASHGCIRLPPDEAAWFSGWQPQGAHVIILPLASKP